MRKMLFGVAAVLLLVGSAHAQRDELEIAAVLSATDCVAKETVSLWNVVAANDQDDYATPGWGEGATPKQRQTLQFLIGTILSTPAPRLPSLLEQSVGACKAQMTALIMTYDRVHGAGAGQAFVAGAYQVDLPRAVWERIRDQFTVISTDGAKNFTCRGLLTANWSVADDPSDDGSRLIRADEINRSCLFDRDSEAGMRILTVCRMGFGCTVRASVDGRVPDVYNIVKVYSVQSMQIPEVR
jgi:hypothetical protein